MDPTFALGQLSSAALLEVLASLQVEVCMLGLAALCFRLLCERLDKASPPRRAKSPLPEPPSPPPASDYDYRSAIKACGLDVEQARILWREMTAKQAPDAHALRNMVKVLVASGCTTEAWELARKIFQADPKLTRCIGIVVYAALRKGLQATGRHSEVAALFQEMKTRSIPTDSTTYRSILGSMACSGQMRDFRELLVFMQALESRAATDSETLSSIIHRCCQSGDLDLALSVLDTVRLETNFTLDDKVYHRLLEGCAQRRWLSRGFDLIEKMQQDGVAPSNYTLSIAVKLLGLASDKARRVDQAFTLVETVSTAYGFRPNIQVYTALMQSCLDVHDFGRAIKLHNRIVERNLAVVDEKVYTVMVSGFLAADAVRQAVMALRCAYQLPCEGGLSAARGRPRGIDDACLRKLLVKVAPACREELETELATRCGRSAAVALVCDGAKPGQPGDGRTALEHFA